MMSKLVKVALIGGLSIIGSVQLAGAAPIINGAAGLPSPTESLTFSEIGLANGTSLTNEYGGFGVTFSGVWYNSQTVGPNINSPNLTNYEAPDGHGSQ